jgi:hypothetical protein
MRFKYCPSRDGTIIPMGKMIVKDDLHLGFEIIHDPATGLIDSLEDSNYDLRAFVGMSLFHQLLDQGDTGKDHALACTGDMRE